MHTSLYYNKIYNFVLTTTQKQIQSIVITFFVIGYMMVFENPKDE